MKIKFLAQYLVQAFPSYNLQAMSDSLCVFVNKVVLGHSELNLFDYYLWLLLCYNSRFEQLQPILYFLVLYRK